MSNKIKKVHHWCPDCEAAIFKGTICPVCKTDINKYDNKKKKDFNRKPLRD